MDPYSASAALISRKEQSAFGEQSKLSASELPRVPPDKDAADPLHSLALGPDASYADAKW